MWLVSTRNGGYVHFPELAAATYLTYLAIMNGYNVGTPEDKKVASGAQKPDSKMQPPGSLSHMGEASLIANLVYVAGLYAQTQPHLKRVEKLNDWLDSKEKELNDVIASSYISEEQFESQKAKVCSEKAGSFDQAIEDLLGFFNGVEQEDKLNQYLMQFNKIQTWYSSLFLYFVDSKLVDELAKNKLLSIRDQYYSTLNAAKVKADFAMTRQSIDGIQQEIAQTRCAADSNKNSIARDMKKLVGRFQMFCDNAMQLYGLRTDKISFQSVVGGEGKARCYYQGFDEQVKSVRVIDEKNSFTSRLEALGVSGNVLFSLSNVSSSTQDSVIRLHPQFYCSMVGSGSFGTEANNRLQSGIYQMSPDIGLGTSASEINGMKVHVSQKAELIRSKVERCNRFLPDSKKVALPDLNSCQLSGG